MCLLVRRLQVTHYYGAEIAPGQRIHRAGEGAPFTGIKPADTDIGPAVPAADKALETGLIEPVEQLLTDALHAGVLKHFREVSQRRNYDPNDVAAGRAFVKAYVEYTHYIEGVYQTITTANPHQHDEAATRNGGHAEHGAPDPH